MIGETDKLFIRYFGDKQNRLELWKKYFKNPKEALEWAHKFPSKEVAYWWLYHFDEFKTILKKRNNLYTNPLKLWERVV